MRDLDSLVDQALQEEWDKAVAEDAVPWNDAQPAQNTPPHVDPDDPRWADYERALRGFGYSEARITSMLAERGTPERDEDFTGFLTANGLIGEGDPTRADWDRYWALVDEDGEPAASGDPGSPYYAALEDDEY